MSAAKRAASPAKGKSYTDILAAIERTSLPKPGARPPTAQGTTAEGMQWLTQNGSKDGVVTTLSLSPSI